MAAEGAQALEKRVYREAEGRISLAPGRTYTLAELIDVGEQHNPETRVAWEQANSKADELGVARSSLYPTLTAVAFAVSLRQAALIGVKW